MSAVSVKVQLQKEINFLSELIEGHKSKRKFQSGSSINNNFKKHSYSYRQCQYDGRSSKNTTISNVSTLLRNQVSETARLNQQITDLKSLISKQSSQRNCNGGLMKSRADLCDRSNKNSAEKIALDISLQSGSTNVLNNAITNSEEHFKKSSEIHIQRLPNKRKRKLKNISASPCTVADKEICAKKRLNSTNLTSVIAHDKKSVNHVGNNSSLMSNHKNNLLLIPNQQAQQKSFDKNKHSKYQWNNDVAMSSVKNRAVQSEGRQIVVKKSRFKIKRIKNVLKSPKLCDRLMSLMKKSQKKANHSVVGVRKVQRYSIKNVSAKNINSKSKLRHVNHSGTRRSVDVQESQFGNKPKACYTGIIKRCNWSSRNVQLVKHSTKDKKHTNPKFVWTRDVSSSKTKLKNQVRKRLLSSNSLSVSKKRSKVITICGVKFSMDQSRKQLTRINSEENSTFPNKSFKAPLSRVYVGGMTYVQTKPGLFEKTNSHEARVIVSRAVNRSINRVLEAKHKKQFSVQNKYCLFYNRFGKCNNGEKCKFVHDPEKIAVCTRFVRGTCKVVDCPFSHKLSQDKMPVCSFFLRGNCNLDNCPYLHVNVNPKAEVCKDFIKGFCPRATECKKLHTLICPVFEKTGKCVNGTKCSLRHRLRKISRLPNSAHVASNSHSAVSSSSAELDRNHPLPSFISLVDVESPETESLPKTSTGKDNSSDIDTRVTTLSLKGCRDNNAIRTVPLFMSDILEGKQS